MNLGERFDNENERKKLYREIQVKDPTHALDAMRALDVWQERDKLRQLTDVDELLVYVRRRVTDSVELMQHMHFDVPLGARQG